MKFRVIIPARLGSTRLPNKPLKEIEGKTLIQRVVEQAKKSNAESVHVATDSKEIENHCKQLDVESLMTNSNHQTGSDRLAESCNILELNDDELVINVQGDEPFVSPSDIDICISHMINKNKKEVMSLDKNLNQNGAIRVMKLKTVFDKMLSTHFSCTINDAIDIHTKNDLKKINT